MATFASATGNLPDVQAAVNLASAGDTVTIPLTGSPFSWTDTLFIGSGVGGSPRNIKLLGDTTGTISSGTLPKIIATNLQPFLIDYTCEDTGFTAQIGKLHFDGYTANHKIKMHGVTTMRGSAPFGGFRLHDCRFTVPYYVLDDIALTGASITIGNKTMTVNNTLTTADVNRAIFMTGVPTGTIVTASTATTITMSQAATQTLSGHAVTLAGKIAGSNNSASNQNTSEAWLWCDDWIEGVVDHCEIDQNLMRYNAGFGLINHNTSNEWSLSFPHGKGQYGDFAFFYKPNGNQNMAGTLHGLYFEDNIIHGGSGACTDTGTTNTGGGGIQIIRHNTTWASFAMHGCRESSGRKRGGRLMEYYNNLFLVSNPLLQCRNNVGPVETRDGEIVYYKNYLQGQALQSLGISTLANMSKSSAYCTSSNNNLNVLGGGPDALNAFDDNQKSTFTDPLSSVSWSPLASYSNGTGELQSSLDGGKDVVTNGVSTGSTGSDTRYGDVYGTVTGGTLSGPPSGSTISGCTVVTQAGGAIAQDSLKNFVIRNPNVDRLLGKVTDSVVSFCRIISNTSGTSGTPGITLQLEGIDIPSATPQNPAPPLAYSGTMELRKVRNYMNVPGSGSQSVRVTDGSNPATLVSGQNRWVQADAAGIWMWGLKHRVGTGAYSDVTPLTAMTTGTYAGIVRDFHQVFGDANAVVNGGGSAIQPLFSRGYPWDHSVAGNSGNPNTRIGADWSKQYLDHGVVVADTTAANSFSPEFASFYADGAGGAVYPHPLVVTPSAQAPTFVADTGATFTAGVANATGFTVRANGDATIVFTVSSGSLPTGVSLTSNGDGTGTIKATSGTSAGVTTVTLQATNSTGHANESYTVTVLTPISVALNPPNNGQTYVAPANITMTATPTSNNGVSKVEFYSGATLIDTETTSIGGGQYQFVWPGIAVGSYAITAKAYDTPATGIATSSVANITVGVISVPAPAMITVLP